MSQQNELPSSDDESFPTLQYISIDETQSWETTLSSYSYTISTNKNRPTSRSAVDEDEVSEQDKREWVSFSERVHMTPPAKITKSIPATIGIANDLLKTASVTSASWDTLSEKEQARMAFMINANLHLEFPSDVDAARNMTKAVFGLSSQGQVWQRNLDNFVRKGGDKVIGKGASESEEGGKSKYRQFVEKHPIWKDPTRSTTIYSLYPSLEPSLRYQEEDTMVCSSVSAATIVDSSQRCRVEKAKAHSDSVNTVEVFAGDVKEAAKRLGMNVARFLRFELTARVKYEIIFLSNGFVLSDMLWRILKPSNPERRGDFTKSFDFNLYATVDALYQSVSQCLTFGPLFTDRLRVYDEYGSSDTRVSKKGPKTYRKDEFHAVTIIGAALTPNENGGMLFLIQDSDAGQPFKNVGLSLLLQMGINELQYLASSNVRFPTGGVFDLDPNFVCTFSGGKFPSHRRSEPSISIDEWKAKGGPLERWYAYTMPDYVPSWTQLEGTGSWTTPLKDRDTPTDLDHASS